MSSKKGVEKIINEMLDLWSEKFMINNFNNYNFNEYCKNGTSKLGVENDDRWAQKFFK